MNEHKHVTLFYSLMSLFYSQLYSMLYSVVSVFYCGSIL